MVQEQSIDMELAESCVQAFSTASGMGCEFCDQNGKLLASGGYSCDVCSVCTGTGISKQDCKRLHSFTAKASEREDGKYLYECPLGLSCITSAVPGPEGQLRRLTAGPFIMEEPQDFRDYDLSGVMGLDPQTVDAIMGRMGQIPYIEPRRVNAFSQLLVYSAAFLSEADQRSEDYLARIEEGTVSAWAKANRIDPAATVKLVNNYMEENFGKDISLLDIAKHAGMTTSYLCRLYKRERGITVNAYLTRLRVEKSKDLLSAGVPIAETAKRCGFSDQSYFTKVFRQVEGTTPLRYKKKT